MRLDHSIDQVPKCWILHFPYWNGIYCITISYYDSTRVYFSQKTEKSSKTTEDNIQLFSQPVLHYLWWWFLKSRHDKSRCTLVMCCTVKLHTTTTGGQHHHSLITHYTFSSLEPTSTVQFIPLSLCQKPASVYLKKHSCQTIYCSPDWLDWLTAQLQHQVKDDVVGLRFLNLLWHILCLAKQL